MRLRFQASLSVENGYVSILFPSFSLFSSIDSPLEAAGGRAAAALPPRGGGVGGEGGGGIDGGERFDDDADFEAALGAAVALALVALDMLAAKCAESDMFLRRKKERKKRKKRDREREMEERAFVLLRGSGVREL